ncbi:hypothetical protein [Enterococcus sp.]|uniref:hypothetical protein n=1 Tax=Enterococcus sp. TaxID=35783 RepID=UPI003C714435
MKKIVRVLLVSLIGLFILTACGSKEIKPDFTTEEAETALNDGKSIDGKTVSITVDKFIPDGTLGYTIWSGEHLNLISSTNPKVEEGDKIIVKVKKVENSLGSWFISYEKLQ